MNPVQKIMAEAETQIADIYKKPVKLILVPLRGSDTKTELTFLTAIVSNALDIEYQEFFIRTRRREIATARAFIYYYAKNEYKIGPTETANYFGHIDHSDVIHGRKKIEELLNAKDDKTLLQYSLIEAELRGHYQLKVQTGIK